MSLWVPVAGRWSYDGTAALYLGSDDPGSPIPHGLSLSAVRLRSGYLRATVVLDETQESAGRILFGHSAATGAYFSLGLGGYDRAYVLSEFVPAIGWKALRMLGSKSNLEPPRPYKLDVQLRGQSVRLIVDGVRVIDENLPSPLAGEQVGVFAWGPGGVKFENFVGEAARPRAFVVMQFGEPYDSLFAEVMKTVADEMGFDAYRAVDVYQPGIILQDIIRGILEAEVVIAEITPPNPNVFYELGYAHALNKPTILLAERGRELPFDIRSYRCIFYDNTIRGKTDVETSLNRHLANILER